MCIKRWLLSEQNDYNHSTEILREGLANVSSSFSFGFTGCLIYNLEEYGISMTP
jgi:hypothetical protein